MSSSSSSSPLPSADAGPVSTESQESRTAGEQPGALEAYRQVTAELTGPDAPFAVQSEDSTGRRAFAGTPPNLQHFLSDAFMSHGDKDLLEYEGRRYRVGELAAAAAGLAAGLIQTYGIGSGDRVGIAMRNQPEWFTAFFAVNQIGAVAVLLNSRAAADELAAAVGQVGCRLVLADDRCAARLAEAGTMQVLDLAGQARLGKTSGALESPAAACPHQDDPVAILFTSGTTGRPRGATLTHRNICSQIRALAYMGAAGLAMTARQVNQPITVLQKLMPLSSQLLIFPMFHISGITSLLIALQSGGLLTMMRRWNPAEALELIERNRVTQLAGPGMVFTDLLAQPDAAEKLKGVVNFTVGGQATPVGLTRRIRNMLPRTSIGGGWGMTESTGAATIASPQVYVEHPGAVGLPAPLVDLRIVDGEGAALAAGAVGEIQLRGPTIMKGYWGDPEGTRGAFEGDWLRTGDLGKVDEFGLLFIVDRAKDMVISAGENIYCAEVERVLSTLEDQVEVALFGVPDDRLGERAIAAVVYRAELSTRHGAAFVQAHVRAQLADYKVPAEVRFDLGPLPRNALGKVEKAELARRYHARAAPSA